VEAYAAFALGAWMSSKSPDDAKTFAKWSALGALAYGMLGQVTYHLLASRGYTEAPWPVVVVVSCMPVAVLGFAAALAHLLGDGRGRGEAQEGDGSDRSPATKPASQVASLPKMREIQQRQGCSPTTAKKIRAELKRFATESPAGLPPRPAGASGRDNGGSPAPVPAALNGHHA